MTVKFLKNAQPIKCQQVLDHYDSYKYIPVSFDTYAETWRNWITSSGHHVDCNQLRGLHLYNCVDYIQGTTQAFDQFVLRHSKNRTIAVLPGEFQYHSCISKYQKIEKINLELTNLRPDHALIISLPFSGTGNIYPNFTQLLEKCDELNVPICLDLAYWGISKNMHLNLHSYNCIEEVVSSLSKPFSVLANHRVGIRFSKAYLDDGISMINETKMQNFYSMSLGVHFMNRFTHDFMWIHFEERYNQLLWDNQLEATETVIFATSTKEEYAEYNRGHPGTSRLCISHLLDEYE